MKTSDEPPRRYYDSRPTDRAVQEMLGLIKGIVCDGVLNDEEISAFRRWLAANPDAASVWPGTILAERIQKVFADGVVDEGERHQLYELFCDTVGDGGHDRSLELTLSTRLPFDDPCPAITFKGQAFVLTGQFVFGPRPRCENEIAIRGGKCLATVLKQPHTLVIGTVASRAWANSDYGRKIERAVEYRSDGIDVHVVSEENWTAALDKSER